MVDRAVWEIAIALGVWSQDQYRHSPHAVLYCTLDHTPHAIYTYSTPTHANCYIIFLFGLTMRLVNDPMESNKWGSLEYQTSAV